MNQIESNISICLLKKNYYCYCFTHFHFNLSLLTLELRLTLHIRTYLNAFDSIVLIKFSSKCSSSRLVSVWNVLLFTLVSRLPLKSKDVSLVSGANEGISIVVMLFPLRSRLVVLLFISVKYRKCLGLVDARLC